MSAALDRAYLSAAITRACSGCERLARELLPGGAGLCSLCDAWIERPKQGAKSTTPRKRDASRKERSKRVAPAPSTMARKITACVDELLRWHLATVRQECSQGSSYAAVSQGSSFVLVAKQLELGAVGSGNRGTKGVWHGAAPTPEELPFACITLDQETEARVASLSLTERETADAVIEDGDGDKLVAVELVGRPWELSLSQRVGLRLVDMNQRAKWLVKIKARDSAPALEGMRARGEAALEALAGQWFAVGVS